MGWFGKNKDEGEESAMGMSLPELPRLPELPGLGEDEKEDSLRDIHQLPSFPSNALGDKMSQNTIKDAVTGRKDGEEVFDADEFGPLNDEEEMMQKPLRNSMTKELPQRGMGQGYGKTSRPHGHEPVFIRLDKFEESLQLFEKAKHQIWEIEKMLHNIKKIKDQEDQELETWQHEIQKVKGQIAKVDQDVFSKIE